MRWRVGALVLVLALIAADACTSRPATPSKRAHARETHRLVLTRPATVHHVARH